MTTTNPLTARFAGDLTLVAPESADRFNASLEQAVAHPRFNDLAMVGEHDDFWSEDGGWCRPYIVQNGVLQIPVKGALLNNFPYQLYDWATGYEYIWEAFKRGCGDYATGTIKGIAFVEDTPGGMVAGCFDAVDKMVALKEKVGVPVRAFAHESAYSAGYAIATVADHIAVSRTGGVGSIGVVTSHIDLSGMYEKMGVKVTFIASDPSKVEGNSSEPLSADAEARIQARIDELYEVFNAAVVRARPLTAEQVRDDLKAYCYTASQAVSNGLADSIGSLEDVTAAYAAFLDDQSDNNGVDEMAEANKSAVDQAALDAARADGRAEGHAAGVTEGATAERARVGAILGSDEAKDRGSLASHIAFSTSMSVEDAKAMLAASPAAVAPAAKVEEDDSFDAAMAGNSPNVGANASQNNGGGGSDEAAEIAELRNLATGFGLRGYAKK